MNKVLGVVLLLGVVCLIIFGGAASAVARDVLFVGCPTCREAVKLERGAKEHKCACGELLSPVEVFERHDERLKRFERASLAAVAASGCMACHSELAIINPKMAFIRNIGGPGQGCVVCHDGNAQGQTMLVAHQGMLRNPGDLWECSKGRGCAKCHSRNPSVLDVMSMASDPIGQRYHVYRVERSLMSTQMGILNNALSANGLQPIGARRYGNFDCDDPLGPEPLAGSATYARWVKAAIAKGRIDRRSSIEAIPTSDSARKSWGLPKSMVVDYYRKECARCHNWGTGAMARGDRRASGCSSCHVPYSNDAYYEGADETLSRDEVRKPLRHSITTAIESVQCTRCHTRGKRIGTSFLGLMEFPFRSPWGSTGHGQPKLHKKRYISVGCDVHLRRGLECVDCHTSVDMHGDGNIYPTTDHAVEIECTDCHGTAERLPWQLPIGHGDCLVLDADTPRGTFDRVGVAYLLSARGNPIGNVSRKDKEAHLRDMRGRTHQVPLLARLNEDPRWNAGDAGIAMARIPHTKTMECYSCHAAWAAQCYGCHLKVDYSGTTTGGVREQRDWLLSAHSRDARGIDSNILTKGKVKETRSYERWERPLLVCNKDGRISPGMPGCQVLATCIDEEGKVVVADQHFTSSQNLPGLAINPAQPHTTSRQARSCESCHVDPKTMGYGIDGGRFARMNANVPGDLKAATKTVAQISPTSFKYDPSQLLTEDGVQTQTMSYDKPVQPLDKSTRDRMDRRGVCVACHRHYGTERWDELRKEHGAVHSKNGHNALLEGLLGGRRQGR